MDAYMECYRQHIEHFQGTFPYVPVNCKKRKVETEKKSKRETWSKQQVAVVVNTSKNLYKEIETFKQLSAKTKV